MVGKCLIQFVCQMKTLKEFAERKDFQPVSVSYGRNGGQIRW